MDFTWYCGCLHQHVKISAEAIKSCRLRIPPPPTHTAWTRCSVLLFRESSSGHAFLWEAEITHVFTYVDGCLCYLIQICKLFSKSCIGTHCLLERVPISVCECAIGRCKLLNFVFVCSLHTQSIMDRLCSLISQRSAAQFKAIVCFISARSRRNMEAFVYFLFCFV